jgi:hypothetical protein
MFSFFTKPVEVRWITGIIIASTLLWCLCVYLLMQHEIRDVNGESLCEELAFFTPLWCLFLAILLVPAFYRSHQQHKFAFGLGLTFGLATYFAWYYVMSAGVGISQLQTFLAMLTMLLISGYAVYLIYHRR